MSFFIEISLIKFGFFVDFNILYLKKKILMCYDNILDKKLLKCNYFMVYLDRWCNIKV